MNSRHPPLSHLSALALLAGLALLVVACSEDGPSPDTSSDVGQDTTPDVVDCGGCPQGKTCCASRWPGDSARCVDTALNPEHCGECGTVCETGACRQSLCAPSPSCTPPGGCEPGFSCSEGGGSSGRCCPEGTSYTVNISSFFGCCPTSDFCGCQQGNCPISAPDHKLDIRLLDEAELLALGERLLSTRLSTWRYEHAPEELRLGFLIDADAPPFAVLPGGEAVDLYGYVSLAVAALKKQQRELDTLRSDLDAIRVRLEKLEVQPSR